MVLIHYNFSLWFKVFGKGDCYRLLLWIDAKQAINSWRYITIDRLFNIKFFSNEKWSNFRGHLIKYMNKRCDSPFLNHHKRILERKKNQLKTNFVGNFLGNVSSTIMNKPPQILRWKDHLDFYEKCFGFIFIIDRVPWNGN